MEYKTSNSSGLLDIWMEVGTGNLTRGGLNTTLEPLDEEALLTLYLHHRRRPLYESSILTVVYVSICLSGMVGNLVTCLVLTRQSMLLTATNYYLLSLAISDLLTLLIGLPPELYTIWEAYPWIFGEPFCIFKTFVSETTASASILTIVAFTFERYLAICHPIKAQTMSRLSRAWKIIVGIWLVACLTALPYPIHTRTFFAVINPRTKQPLKDSLVCNIPFYWLSTMKYMFQLTTFILFIIPMTIISVLYILIGLTLRRSRSQTRATAYPQAPSAGSSRASKSRRAVLKMLVAVVVAFFLCWAPFHAQRLMTAFLKDDQWTDELKHFQDVLFYMSGVLYFVSSTVNPILYNLMSRKYRQAFKETVCRCFLNEEARMRLARGRYYSDRSTGMTSGVLASSVYVNSLRNSRENPNRIYNLDKKDISRNGQKHGGRKLWDSRKEYTEEEKNYTNAKFVTNSNTDLGSSESQDIEMCNMAADLPDQTQREEQEPILPNKSQ